MRWRRRLAGIGCAIAALALAGCATPGYNASHIQKELQQAGTTPAQAECVTNRLTGTFDEKQLGSHSEPSNLTPSSQPGDKPGTTYESEVLKARDIIKACGVTVPLNPIP